MKAIKVISITAISAALLCVSQAEAATGAAFLRIGVGARSEAMGGAYSAVAEGPEGMWLNPAAIGFVEGQRAMVMHNDYVSDISQEYVGYMREGQGKDWFNQGNWGLSFMRMDLGGQQGFNAANVATGTFTPTDTVVSLGYGRKLNPNLAFGVAFKYIDSEIANFADSTIALDLGAVYKVPDQPLRLALAIQNVGNGLQLGATADDLPTLVRLGAAYRLPENHLLLTAEGEFARDENAVWKIGAEYPLSEIIKVRAGYNTSNDLDNGYTYGLGLLQKRYAFNYAYIPFGTFGNTHRFALDFAF
jgi:long-subunit fatty acid transport protein